MSGISDKLLTGLPTILNTRIRIMDLKKRIDQLLKSRRMTTEELCKKISFSRSTYYDQFSNEDFKLEFLKKVAKVFKMTVSELIEEVPITEPKNAFEIKLDEILKRLEKTDQTIKGLEKIIRDLQKKSEVVILE